LDGLLRQLPALLPALLAARAELAGSDSALRPSLASAAGDAACGWGARDCSPDDRCCCCCCCWCWLAFAARSRSKLEALRSCVRSGSQPSDASQASLLPSLLPPALLLLLLLLLSLLCLLRPLFSLTPAGAGAAVS
jgi:hypothetical protein